MTLKMPDTLKNFTIKTFGILHQKHVVPFATTRIFRGFFSYWFCFIFFFVFTVLCIFARAYSLSKKKKLRLNMQFILSGLWVISNVTFGICSYSVDNDHWRLMSFSSTALIAGFTLSMTIGNHYGQLPGHHCCGQLWV